MRSANQRVLTRGSAHARGTHWRFWEACARVAFLWRSQSLRAVRASVHVNKAYVWKAERAPNTLKYVVVLFRKPKVFNVG